MLILPAPLHPSSGRIVHGCRRTDQSTASQLPFFGASQLVGWSELHIISRTFPTLPRLRGPLSFTRLVRFSLLRSWVVLCLQLFFGFAINNAKTASGRGRENE